MLASRLRANGGDRPDFRVKIDFVPTRRERLAGSGRRQDAKFERPRRRRRPLAKPRDEGGNVSIGHGRMMAARQLGALWQELVEMAAPARGIGFVVADVSARLGCVQYRL